MNWMREEFERAKARNALLPKHARPTLCGPALTTRKRPPRLPLSERMKPLCDQEVEPMGCE